MPILNSMFIALFPILLVFNMENKMITRTYTIDGQQVTCTVEEFIPPLVFKDDSTRMNQTTAVNCSHLFYSFLAKGDIEGAAALSNEPAKVKEKFSRQKERAGIEEFKKMYEDYFGGKATLKYQFSLGKSRMLIIHSEDMGVDLCQFYVEEGKKFLVEEQGSAEKDQLGKIFQLLKNEEDNVIVK